MDFAQIILVEQLKRLQATGIRKVIKGEATPEISMPRDFVPFPRIIVPLSGKKKIEFAMQGKVVIMNLAPGEALLMPGLCCTRTYWRQAHEMISAVLRKDLLRVIYINNPSRTEEPASPPVADAFCHIKENKASTRKLFEILCAPYGYESQCCQIKLVECLLEFIIDDLNNAENKETSLKNPCHFWSWIIEYVHTNVTREISRDSIAKQFNITPQYVSILFKKNTGFSFKEYLTVERLKYAVELLTETNLTIDEIAWKCGYKHVSHFIKVFRNNYHKPPGMYRRGILKNSKTSPGSLSSQ